MSLVIGFFGGSIVTLFLIYRLLLNRYVVQKAIRHAVLMFWELPGYRTIGLNNVEAANKGRQIGVDPDSPVLPKYTINVVWDCPQCRRPTFFGLYEDEILS